MTQTQPNPVTCSRHELTWCTAPGCPGAAVKRKLEAFDELLRALDHLVEAEWMVEHNWGGDREPVLLAARAVIAQAKEVQ